MAEIEPRRLNDSPYGSERVFNGLRLAAAVAKRYDTEVRVFLMGDAVGTVRTSPAAAHAWMHAASPRTCSPRAGRSTLDELADWTLWAEQVVTF